jgi:hypothetical protein
MVEGEAVVLQVVWEPMEVWEQEQQALGVRSPIGTGINTSATAQLGHSTRKDAC